MIKSANSITIILFMVKLGVSLHQPPVMRQTSIGERDGGISLSSCAVFGADCCVNGYRGLTHD